ncbi:hypothetical protein [Spirosoma pollinicola]|uniref:Uncharacterized protein n=1 Tax=Spirosoma pollinicola TaxID=2057025 RepID=A0A2K8YTK2_9BACT|nr:hypothetical protein [Spirosoma pollinicola]AUD00950.1 hypothetical protein CWM47_03430 [Spirosoma pollinicola]
MQHCVDRTISSCFHYLGTHSKPMLDAFLTANGGKPAEELTNGTAIFSSQFKIEERLVYVKPGSWVQVKGKGQFFTHTNEKFLERFALVEKNKPTAEPSQPVKKEGVLAGLSHVNAPLWLSKLMSRQPGRKTTSSKLKK